MAEKTYKTPPPIPLSMRHDGAVAVRSPDESTDAESGCFVFGHMLTLDVRDVRTGRTIKQGGYLKSVKITLDGDTDIYLCEDATRYPPAEREVETYKDDAGEKTTQKGRFYRWVSSSLKRLGYYTGAISDKYSSAIGEAMQKLYQVQTGTCVEKIDDCLADFSVHLRDALGGRDEVGADGKIHIGLPEVTSRKKATVRVEFHDVKYVLQQDVADAAEAAWGQCDEERAKLVVPNNLPGMAVVYDRASASLDAEDPDHIDKESAEERSNWCLQVKAQGGGPHKIQFRNYHDFEVTLDTVETVQAHEVVYALTWCQPVWHDELAFRREAEALTKFTGPPVKTPNTAINSLHPTNGASSYNYAVFGLFRTAASGGKTYFRLHTGIDLTGREREENGFKRTPVFAVNGGRATKYGSNVRLNHRDEQVTRYVHMHGSDILIASNRWVKAGSLLGKMGRNDIPPGYPTHCHFETLLADTTGWDNGSFSELPNGAAKVAQYPRNGGVDKCTENPKYIKYQYGEWTRDPGAMLKKWIDAQLGGNAFADHFAHVMPASWPSNHTPPCRLEFGAGNDNHPGACTAACVTGNDQLVATQVAWAKSCWGIRTSTDPAKCCCPGISKNGLAKSFTKRQRIQYHLWQLGEYDAAFDGDFGGTSINAIEQALPVIDVEVQKEVGNESLFAGDVRTETDAVIAAEAKKKKVDVSTITETIEHRRLAVKNLLKKSDKVDLLLDELQRIAPHL
jgi:murein DD-endopeptidase MepM/ murein hydrolase activator NlpD